MALKVSNKNRKKKVKFKAEDWTKKSPNEGAVGYLGVLSLNLATLALFKHLLQIVFFSSPANIILQTEHFLVSVLRRDASKAPGLLDTIFQLDLIK